MELRHLRYFVAVAEMENVSRAATQRLHVAQPSLSRQIRDLEDEVAVQLLERTAKSVRLTEAGRAFPDEARSILKHPNEAVLKARMRSAASAIRNCTSEPRSDWLFVPRAVRLTKLKNGTPRPQIAYRAPDH